MTKTLTCGKAYCEHHPEGLPVCAKCREESALAHDRACAELAEARAEIEGLMLMATNGNPEPARRLMNTIKELRAEIERLKGERENSLDRAKNYTLKLSDAVTRQAGELFAKNKLIEQMRRALESVKQRHYVNDDDSWYSCPASGLCSNDSAGTDCNCGADRANSIIEAALAAERGGK